MKYLVPFPLFYVVNNIIREILTAMKLPRHLVVAVIIAVVTSICTVRTTRQKSNALSTFLVLVCVCVLYLECVVCLCVLQNTQRISSSQSTQPLATPVVSVTTPSLPPQGLLYSGMPTSYNPAGESGPALPSD